MEGREMIRQFIHMALGILFIAMLFLLGRHALLVFTFFAVILGSLLINMYMQGRRLAVVDAVRGLERGEVAFPGYGSAWYMVGMLVLASFLTEPAKIASGIFLLGISDGVSTLVGIYGRHKLPFNPRKSWEGSAAFFATALFTWVWIGPVALPLALIASVVESLPLPWDDNVLVPLATAVFLRVI